MTDFLTGFAQALVHRLVADGQLELADGTEPAVAAYLARELARLGEGQSLLSNVERALLRCPEVEEVYFDLDRLKEVVQDLGGGFRHA